MAQTLPEWLNSGMDLSNRVVLITGARRIGGVLARELAAGGADIAVSYRSSHVEADDTCAAVRAIGRRAVAISADLADSTQCRALVDETVRQLGRLDILVNMASHYAPAPFDTLTDAELNHGLRVDLEAAFACSQAAVPAMRAAGGGRVINFSDWLPVGGRPRYKGYLPYYVAKGGVIALTEALALELADDRILVNAIAPGPILAPPDLSEDERKAVEEATPLGRWGGAQEIVKVVRFLIDSDFVTGEVIRVDGGRHLR